MHTTSNINTRILRLPEVKQRIGLCRSSIYERIKAGNFPKNIRLGARSVGWLESEIESWIADRINASRDSSNGGKHAV